MVQKLWIYLLWLLPLVIFLNIKHWFVVIRYLMTSSWRHNACFLYLLCSKYMPSFKFKFASMCFLSTIYRPKRKKKQEKKKKKTEQKQ